MRDKLLAGTLTVAAAIRSFSEARQSLRRLVTFLAVAAISTLFLASLVRVVCAQTLTVQFAVDQNTAVTIASGNDKGDQIRITGGRSATVDATGCVQAGSPIVPIQEAVVVDPAANRATRLTEVILISQQTPLPAGTKIDNVSVVNACHIPSGDFNVYQGTIE